MKPQQATLRQPGAAKLLSLINSHLFAYELLYISVLFNSKETKATIKCIVHKLCRQHLLPCSSWASQFIYQATKDLTDLVQPYFNKCIPNTTSDRCHLYVGTGTMVKCSNALQAHYLTGHSSAHPNAPRYTRPVGKVQQAVLVTSTSSGTESMLITRNYRSLPSCGALPAPFSGQV